jgi:trehalose/maltose hydrolase-like predicted phosphorylase
MDAETAASDRFENWLAPSADPDWLMVEEGYDPAREAEIEACFAIGNGMLGVRASRAISRGATWVAYQHHLNWASWPRTYIAGLFDTPNVLPPVPGLVPAPDWLRLRVWIDDRLLLLRSGELQAHRRTLDLRRGVLLTDWAQREPGGRIVRMQTLRAVSLADRALAIQLMRLSLEGEPAKVRLEASFELTGSALDLVRIKRDSAIWRTAESGKVLAVSARAGLQVGKTVTNSHKGALKWTWSWEQESGNPVAFVRLAAFAKGGADASAAEKRAARTIRRAEAAGWPAVLAAHESAWAARWRCSDVELAGDDKIQTALRFAVYHLISAANPDDERVSIGARALTGDAYLGHVFWDTEIYLLPFYIFTWPEAARSLLMYRFHSLPGARAKAERFGYRGALYAWESTDTGEETTPEQVIDSEGRLIPVLCGLEEHHISADVAYAVWQYWQATLDDEFFLAAGAEILLDTARFWASRAQREADGRYHIRRVIGPDEYHETIDDNAYTNVMAAWNIERGLDTMRALADRWRDRARSLRERLALDDAELDHWAQVAEGLVRGDDSRSGLIEQFAGYFGLEDIDLSAYATRTVPMDVVLGRARTAASQVVKQADVVALLALLPDLFDHETQRRNFAYYEPRCGHGSTLSPALHALVAARLRATGLAAAYLRRTADIDLESTIVSSAGGIHIAALGGVWMAVVQGFAGFRPLGEELVFDPALPDGWRSLAFRLQWRGRSIHVRIDQDRELFTATLERGAPLSLRVNGERLALESGSSMRRLSRRARGEQRCDETAAQDFSVRSS